VESPEMEIQAKPYEEISSKMESSRRRSLFERFRAKASKSNQSYNPESKPWIRFRLKFHEVGK